MAPKIDPGGFFLASGGALAREEAARRAQKQDNENKGGPSDHPATARRHPGNLQTPMSAAPAPRGGHARAAFLQFVQTKTFAQDLTRPGPLFFTVIFA